MKMFLVLVLSTVVCIVSAANETRENDAIGVITQVVIKESQLAAGKLAGYWDKNEKTDKQTIEKFLKEVGDKVFDKVKKEVVALVVNVLGEAVVKVENSDMYKMLEKMVRSYSSEMVLGKARSLSKIKNIGDIVPRQGGSDKMSKSIAELFNGIANKNATEKEKAQLINKSQKQIDNFIKLTINPDTKSKSKVASRSGSFFYNNYLQQQQQQSLSSVAHKLAQQLTGNMCSPSPYTSPCQMSCQPNIVCNQCPYGQGQGSGLNYVGSSGSHSSYDHVSSSYKSSGSSGFDVSSGGLIGSGHHSLPGGPVHLGDMSSNGIGHHSLNTGDSRFGDISSSGLIGGGHSGQFGTGNLVGGGSHSFSGSLHNSHSSAVDTSMASSYHNTGHHGHGVSDITGSYGGVANLWSLNKGDRQTGISGSSLGGSNYDSGRLYGGSSFGGGNSYPGGLGSVHGHGLGNMGEARQYNGHYSSSNSKSISSSKTDSSNHLSYGSSGNIW